MPKRSPVSDPQPGDVLAYGGWRIEVVSVWNGVVSYRKSKDGEWSTGTQTLAVWSGWAGSAKVKACGMAADECLVTSFAAGNCSQCETWTERPHLSGVKILCAGCCPAARHIDSRKKKETVNA